MYMCQVMSLLNFMYSIKCPDIYMYLSSLEKLCKCQGWRSPGQTLRVAEPGENSGSTRGDLNSRHSVYKTDALISELLGQAHWRALFSAQPAKGAKTKKMLKYSAEAIWPMMTKGCSTGIPPIQVRIMTSATRSQNKNCVIGRNVMPRCLEV